MEDAPNGDPKELIDGAFDPKVMERAAVARLDEIQEEVSSAIQRIGYLSRYITGPYFSDSQRLMAERQVFALRKRISHLATAELSRAVHITLGLHDDVTAHS